MSEALLRYEKLAAELEGLISGGILKHGERLPSVRRLSEQRRLSISTVVHALRQLESRGLVEARPQSGYFVRHAGVLRSEPMTRRTPEMPIPVNISQRLASFLKSAMQPGVVPLAAALPAPELLPVAVLRNLYAKVARCQPGLLEGGNPININEAALIRQLVRRSLVWGGPLDGNEIVITNSCTEALGLCLRAVTRPGDTVAVESPAYYLMLQLLETLGLRALEIPTDPRTGISVEALDLATRQGGVAACLLVSNASNPLGCVMPDANKRRLAALAAARGVVVIEDDIYGDLHFGGERPWPVKAFDSGGNVMLCASFSKSLSPSLRIGFVAAGRFSEAVAMQKTLVSGATNPITQQVLAAYLESGAFERHLRAMRRTCERQVESMRAAATRHFPAATRISRPQGGFVLWLELPEEIDTLLLFERAIAEKIAFLPGTFFSASGMYRNCLRLNCGNPHTPEIESAVRRLGALFANA